MKKLFTLLLTIGSFTAVFAQGGHNNDRENNGYGQRNNDVVMNNDHGRNYGSAPVYNYPSDRGTENRGRHQDMDRRNKDYDQRGNDYGYGRPAPVYDRDRRVNEVQRDRRDNNGSFATGAVVGGIAGVLLGVLISHR